jgi:hypothetical protein
MTISLFLVSKVIILEPWIYDHIKGEYIWQSENSQTDGGAAITGLMGMPILQARTIIKTHLFTYGLSE